MRLTIRNLLAYMDDYLLPKGGKRLLQDDDFNALAKKVQGNAFAQELMRRIRDVVRRVRLGVPSESESGAGLDPNTVAEYLDHALPEARVPDFEKICLESDAQLAEVACCHQILARVMREPAEVEESCRERAYQLPHLLADQADEQQPVATAETLAEEIPSGGSIQGSPAKPTSREVPEYLRTSVRDRHRRTLWIAAALVAGIGIAGWLLLGGVDGIQRMVATWGAASQPMEPVPTKLDRPSGDQEADVFPAEHKTGAATVKDVKPASASAPAAASPPVLGLAPTPGPDEPPKSKVGLPPPPPKESAPGPRTAEASQPVKQASVGSSGATVPSEAASQSDLPRKELSKDSEAPTASAMGASAGAEVAKLVSTKQVLLRWNPKKGVWTRLPDQAGLGANDRLIALPGFRPRVNLAGQTSLVLVNATAATLLAPDAEGVAGVVVEFGRVLIRGEQAAARIRVRAGDYAGTCQLADKETELALEVRRSASSGEDPETQPGPLAAHVYVVSGGATWRDQADGKEIRLNSPVRLALDQVPLEPISVQQVPSWLTADANPLEQRAAQVVERELMVGRSAILELRALSVHRQREVRWLSLESLSLVDDYEPLIGALEDPDASRQWVDFIELLQAAVFRSPQSAARVRSTIEQRYGPAGVAIYEMLWKYRPENLKPEDASHLVDLLNHEELAFRVLSFWNLKNLTNRTFYYRPEDPAAKRQTAILKWKEYLRAGAGPRSETPAMPEAEQPEHAPPEGLP